MRMQDLIKILTLSLILFLSGNLYAQITIGCRDEPVKGALLDLKQKNSTNKGLALPRVKLSNQKKLKMGDYEIFDRQNGRDQYIKHTGLIVYNVEKVHEKCENGKYYPGHNEGLSIWTGKKWKEVPAVPVDVRSIIDHGSRIFGGRIVGTFTMKYKDEKEKYYYADFGEAGVWMTQNLRTKYAPDGTALINSGYSKDDSSNEIKDTNIKEYTKVFAYPHQNPSTDDGDPTNSDIIDSHKEYGLLYDWYTATDGKNCSVSNQGQEEAGEDKYIIYKGICPIGWHLPSDKEWNQLEKYITENASLLTQTPTNNGNWDNAWSKTTGERDSSTPFKSKTSVLNSRHPLTGADSKTAQSGGFDAYLTGNASRGKSMGYGYDFYFWTSSSYLQSSNGLNQAWGRRSYSDSNGAESKMYRGFYFRYTMQSVRCKKDR